MILAHYVLATLSNQFRVTHLTVTQRHRVMVFPMKRMLNIQLVVSNTDCTPCDGVYTCSFKMKLLIKTAWWHLPWGTNEHKITCCHAAKVRFCYAAMLVVGNLYLFCFYFTQNYNFFLKKCIIFISLQFVMLVTMATTGVALCAPVTQSRRRLEMHKTVMRMNRAMERPACRIRTTPTAVSCLLFS